MLCLQHMDTKSTGIGMVCLLSLSLLLGVALYPSLPPDMAVHWNYNGLIDGYASKVWGIVLLPFLLLGIYIAWITVPVIEPMQKNFNAFRNAFNGFMMVLAFFFFYCFILIFGFNLGWEINMAQALAPGLALVLAAVAVLLENSKRNYFVGMRTPWTLSSDKVWKRTNFLSAKLFYFCAVCVFAGVVYPDYLAAYIILPLIATIFITTLYSYIEFRRL